MSAFAIMAVDPGDTTGIACGLFRDQETVAKTVRRAVLKRAVRTGFVRDAPERQGVLLAKEWRSFVYFASVEQRVRFDRCYLVVEDFQLRQMAVALSPVAVEAALRARTVEQLLSGDWHDDVAEGCYSRQSSADAKSRVTNDRLRELGLWPLGRIPGGGDHKRDALRHLVLKIARLLDGSWS
jgi:hypothetical protein